MTEYQHFDGSSYLVSNIYKSIRYDVDKLEMNAPGIVGPAFVSGVRIVDSKTDVTVVIDGVEADYVLFSLALIYYDKQEGSFQRRVDNYLMTAMLTEEFLVSEQKSNAGVIAPSIGSAIALH